MKSITPIKAKSDTVSLLEVSLKTLVASYVEMKHRKNAAVEQALIFGQQLIEFKSRLKRGESEGFLEQEWVRFEPECAEMDGENKRRAFQAFRRQCYRCIKLAETVFGNLQLPEFSTDLPLSLVLTSRVEDLPAEAAQAQQLVFDFTEGKTMKECLEGVVVDGDEPHRITRAHNGKTKGGSKGENRKDFPKFIANKLSDVTTHLESWDSMTAIQRGAIEDHFERALGEWPKALLEKLRDQLKKEMQKR